MKELMCDDVNDDTHTHMHARMHACTHTYPHTLLRLRFVLDHLIYLKITGLHNNSDWQVSIKANIVSICKRRKRKKAVIIIFVISFIIHLTF